MYRTLLPILFYLSYGSSAPQESTITYVKMQPITDDTQLLAQETARQSRIENLPLTIQGGKSDDTDTSESPYATTEALDTLEGETPEDVAEAPESAAETPELPAETSEVLSKIAEAPAETPEVVTTAAEDVTFKSTESYDSKPKQAAPRFFSKLSYFQKPEPINSILSNLIEPKLYERKFKSKCRCERIWNCPKLQITVPRCPTDYFLCCF